jgi:hypothetical protein
MSDRFVPKVEARKPFLVYEIKNDCSGETAFIVVCNGSEAMFPNTHSDTSLVRFNDKDEADKLANALNETFANHFDV